VRALVILAAMLTGGCAYQVAGLALATDDHDAVPFEVLAPDVRASQCVLESALGYHQYPMPLGWPYHPSVQSLMRKALATVSRANAMADVTVETSEYFILIGRLTCVRLRGDAVRIRAEGP